MMEDVAEAARKARYNEAIVVSVTSDENPAETREIVLTATLDETNGGVVWNDASNGGVDEDVAIVRHLRTKRWVLPMLNDRRRNELYDEAIRAATYEAARRFKNQCQRTQDSCIHALDIGTGTGLLAMMTSKHLRAALQSNADVPKVQITSLEMASAMARLAKLTVASNDLQDSINVLEEHSCEANLKHKFWMCTSELLESGLLGEGILPSLRDAWHRHLHPDAVIVPQKARVYAQLIESSGLVGNFCGPHSSADDDSCSLRFSTSPDGSNVLLRGNVIVPIHAESLFSSDPAARLLTNPVLAMVFDFSKQKISCPEGQRQITNLAPNKSGVAHGVLFWWELDLWDDITYSTQQGKEPWQDHWHQCLFVLEENVYVRKGQVLSLQCSHTDDRLSFSLECPSEPKRDSKRQRIAFDQALSTAQLISPERALQLNDNERLSTIRTAIKFALKRHGKHAHFLDVSDFSLCAMLAALEGATFVSSLESSSGELPMTAAMVSQANGLPRRWIGKIARYQILQCHAGSLTSAAFNDEAAAIVAAEPYYEVLEGWHLQEALNYFYLLRSLRGRGLIQDTYISIPSCASVMICGIECESLVQAYKGCGDGSEEAKICGFNHSDVKHYGDRYHQNGFPIRACEYDYAQLTEAAEVSRLCYDELSSIVGNDIQVKVPFQRGGTCHGILSWIEYGMQVEATREATLSTNNKHHRQLFQLLSNPAIVSKGGHLLCRLKVGDLEGVEDHRFDLTAVC